MAGAGGGVESTHKMGVDYTPDHDHIEWQVSQFNAGEPSGGHFGASPGTESSIPFKYGAGTGPAGPDNASQGGRRK